MKTHFSERARATALAAALAVLAVSSVDTGLFRVSAAASPQPPQRGARDTVITVSTAAELQAAVGQAVAGSTILLRPGTYTLTRTLFVSGAVSDLTIKGATENPADVVLVGGGMAHTSDDVPHGIVVERGAQRITIANLTIRDVAQYAIVLKPGTRSPRIQNVRLANAGAGFVKAEGDGRRGGSSDGVIEYSVLEYALAAPEADVRGIEVAGGTGWTIRHNLFRNIQAPAGQMAGPALLIWQGSRDSVVDGNLFMNSQREIALGLEDRTPHDHTGGIVRNNFIYRDSMIQGDAAILLADAPNAQVLHNTILVNGTYTSPIEYRFPDTTGVVIRNNLLDGMVVARDQATGTASDNYTQANPAMFVNAAAGDLHLAGTALAAFDQVRALDDARLDFDGEPRGAGGLVDYGADERTGPVDPQPLAEPLPPQPATDFTNTSTQTSTTQKSSDTTITMSSANAEATTTAPGALPEPWKSMDIGNTRRGLDAWLSDKFVIQGGGLDISGNADHFRFVYHPFDGDGEIVARVDTLEPTHPWAKAGVMIRDELTSQSKYAGAFVTPAKGLVFQRRIATGATTTTSNGGAVKAPYWLKVVRSGDTFTSYSSHDGLEWTVIGSEIVYLKPSVYAGLAVTSHSSRSLASAIFSGVEVTASTGGSNQAPTVAITAPTDGSSMTSPATVDIAAAATDPDGTVAKVDFYAGSAMIGSATSSPFRVTWSNAPEGRHALKAVAQDDKGASSTSPPVEIEVVAPANQAPSVSLTAPADGASFTAPATISLSAQATDSDGTIAAVEFYADGKPIGTATTSPFTASWSGVPAGSYALTAVARDNDGATTTSAPVRVTVLSPANQAPTVALTEPLAGTTFTAPASITMTASAADPDGTVTKVEFFAGSMLVGSASSSPYSVTWSGAPTGIHTLTAKAWDNAGASATSMGVTVTVKQGPTLPEGWLAADVGSPAVAGSASYADEAFTVSGAGKDIWNSSDQFHYVYQPFEGDGALEACVTAVDFVDPWTKAGVMFREALTGESVHAFMLLSAGSGADLQYRLQTGGGSAQHGPTPAVAPHCVRLLRKGNTFSGYHSLDGANWTLLGSQTIAMSASAYVGLAVTSHNSSTAATARFERVAFTEAPPNQEPTVSLTAPASGATYTEPANITLGASASDPDGSITKVDFYAGATLVGSANASPFSATWNGAPAGTHPLTAVAFDDSGASTTSAPVSVTVNANQSPTVSLTAPAAGATFTAPATVTFSANASDPDGSIAVVEFYASGVLLGSDTTNSYSISISGMPEGTYSITVVARDNAGATTTSAPVSITVNAAPASLPRQVVFTASADHDTAVTSYAVEVFVAGANPSTTSPFRTQNVGKPTPVNGDITVDVSAMIDALPAGTYFITVSATGSGGTSRSAPSETFTR